ncbi:permease of the major facilitator superfamily [Vibrio ishigakensis]|uniref:Permease of the major facilitator superfamily n=2 Tax=Vibrio ishigakensis TaxID=1481914 RepID=A0A0B8NRT7_9VIBR|nr:hypothetical protein [Vibrio ishigakensis]GAM54997.1 permease of the major facilitator superfamily [Vibrio ishigakensis]
MWAKHKKKVYILVGILAFLGLAKFFGLAFTVHGNDIPAEYWTNVSPLKAKLFDKPVFMGFLAAMTLLTLSLAVWGYWVVHSMPKKHSEHTGQAKLVFWLCMLGFFWGWLWIAAILIVVTDWSKIANVIKGRAV